MSAKPRGGDVVVQSRAVAGEPLRFTLRVFDRPAQFQEGTYEWALNRADAFAREAHVDVWYTDDGVSFKLIMRRRSSATASDPG